MGVAPPQNRVLLKKPVLARLFIKTVLQSRLLRVFAKIQKIQPWISSGSGHQKSACRTFLKALNPPFPTKTNSATNIAYFKFYSPPKWAKNAF